MREYEQTLINLCCLKDTDIPQEGRMVQCSNCSQKWFQAPIKTQSSITPDTDKKVSKMGKLIW